MLEIDELLRRRLEVEAWLARPGATLWSRELCEDTRLPKTSWDSWELTGTARPMFAGLAEQVVQRRRAALGAPARSEASGRWAVYDPDYSGFWDLARGETNDFFANADCLPWELWVGWFGEIDRVPNAESDAWHGAMIVWVPARFVGVFDRGLQFTVSCPVLWADDPFLRRYPAGAKVAEFLRSAP